MPLPILNNAEYDVTLPVSKQKVIFRPFLMKEQKILLMAAESKDPKQITRVISTLLDSCCKGLPNKIEEMSVFDVETLFMNIRAKSVGENVDVKFKCECGEVLSHTVKLLEVPIVNKELLAQTGPTRIILANQIGVTLKPMQYGMIQKVMENMMKSDGTAGTSDKENFTVWLSIIQSSIESVFDATQNYKFSDCTEDEKTRFMDSLSIDQLLQIIDHYSKTPKYQLEITETCKKCSRLVTHKLESIYDFFT